VSRITARRPNREAYVKICPTLEEEIHKSTPLASVIIGETLNALADLEDEEERRSGECYFCMDFKVDGKPPRIKQATASYVCKYCPICGRKFAPGHGR
jgi:hypothetical protein